MMRILSEGPVEMELCGKLIIKVQLGDDIRRVPIHNEELTYDELVLMMQRVFRGSLIYGDDLLIKYKDEDGDLITIFDNSDLSFAIQTNKVLRLTLLNGKASTLSVNSNNLSVLNLRRELQIYRDKVITILDALDLSSDPTNQCEGNDDTASNLALTQATQHMAGNTPKEFDPLQQEIKIEAAATDSPKACSNTGNGNASGALSASSTPTPSATNNAHAPSPSHSTTPLTQQQQQQQMNYPTYTQTYSSSHPPASASMMAGSTRPAVPSTLSSQQSYVPYSYPQMGGNPQYFDRQSTGNHFSPLPSGAPGSGIRPQQMMMPGMGPISDNYARHPMMQPWHP